MTMITTPQALELPETDTLHRFVFENTPVRGNMVNLTHTLTQALKLQSIPVGLRKNLGELMAASALLSATLKMNGSIVLQIQSKGALKLLVVECNANFGMRATAKWSGEVTDEQTMFDLIENGQFIITLDPKLNSAKTEQDKDDSADHVNLGKNQIYQGIVPLEGDSIGEILENYMLRSEQIDTRIWLYCDEKSAGGLLIQKLPDTMNQTTRGLEQKAADLETWNRVQHLASTITETELLNLPAKTILTRLFNQEDVRLFDAAQTHFYCSCSRDSVANMLRMLGNEEITSILEEQNKIEVHCDFCNTQYTFDKVDASALLVTDPVLPSSKAVH